MKKKYFLYAVVCMVLIFSGFGLSFASNTSPDNEKSIKSRLGDLNKIVGCVDMNNLLSDEPIISENEPSQSDEEAAQSEVCEAIEETQEITEYVSDQQPSPIALVENKTADEDDSNPFDFLEEFSFIKEIHSSMNPGL
ncbi:MAG: hypothetical protein ABIH18_08060 [Candidatus Omnitrophota bacterium]